MLTKTVQHPQSPAINYAITVVAEQTIPGGLWSGNAAWRFTALAVGTSEVVMRIGIRDRFYVFKHTISFDRPGFEDLADSIMMRGFESDELAWLEKIFRETIKS